MIECFSTQFRRFNENFEVLYDFGLSCEIAKISRSQHFFNVLVGIAHVVGVGVEVGIHGWCLLGGVSEFAQLLTQLFVHLPQGRTNGGAAQRFFVEHGFDAAGAAVVENGDG